MEKYNKIRSLGKGTYGITFLVQRKSDLKLFAIKELSMVGMENHEKKSIDKYLSIIFKLDHKNIVGFVDYFKSADNDTFYIVMEYASGGNLKKLIDSRNKKHLSEQEVLKYFFQICEAVLYLHSNDNNIVHRDIKPSNIFLSDLDMVRIGDFGLAAVIERSRVTNQNADFLYSPPEFFDDGKATFSSDIWMLGCVLYELFTLEYPFSGLNTEEIMDKILEGKFNPLPEYVSDDLRDLIKNMLQVKPENRPTIQKILELKLFKKYKREKCPDMNSFMEHVFKLTNDNLIKPKREKKD